MPASLDVYLELGTKKVFASAVEWPGWSRSGGGEDDALKALVAYGPRYKAALGTASRGLQVPTSTSGLAVTERLKGSATTDFGTLAAIPTADTRELDRDELDRLIKILKASWAAFDGAAEAAEGKALSTGPRGGGRDVAKMRRHVLEGDVGNASRLGATRKMLGGSFDTGASELRDVFIEVLEGRWRGDVADRGPRGGVRSSPRQAVRGSAWHALDHAWELEDRAR